MEDGPEKIAAMHALAEEEAKVLEQAEACLEHHQEEVAAMEDGPIFQFLQNSSHNYFHYFYHSIFFYNLKKVKSNYLSTL